MLFPRLSFLALLLSPMLPLHAAAAEPAGLDGHPVGGATSRLEQVELIATEPTDVLEATLHPAAAADEPADVTEMPADLSHGPALMTPISVSGGIASTEPEREEVATLDLPEPEPLESSTTKLASLMVPPLKALALKSNEARDPLDETVEREELAASAVPGELIEPSEIESTDIAGQTLIDPLTLIISLKDQRLDVYRGLEKIDSTRVSSGRSGYQTLTGVFGILEKKPEHFSNLYDAAPMPWMQRLTRSGTALHAGAVPNYPASHGCVRMPYAYAPKLFRMTEVGGKVAMMTGPMVKPERIESPTLVMPATAAGATEIDAAASVDAGLKVGALAAALPAGSDLADVTEPAGAANTAPWHILVTRREERDIAIGAQEALAAMGYLEPQEKFVGYLGDDTRKAIRAFEKDHGLRQRGVFSEDIAAEIYKAAGKGPLPDAYLFLRKGFSRVRHVPVELRDPKEPLGTHLLTYVRPTNGDAPGWIGISLEGDDSKSVLDRITIPQDMRDEIADGLTSGASFIVADVGKHSSVLPEGDDFIVRTNDSAASNVVAEKAKAEQRKVARQRAAAPKKRVVRTETQRRVTTKFRSSERRSVSAPRGFKLFGRR